MRLLPASVSCQLEPPSLLPTVQPPVDPMAPTWSCFCMAPRPGVRAGALDVAFEQQAIARILCMVGGNQGDEGGWGQDLRVRAVCLSRRRRCCHHSTPPPPSQNKGQGQHATPHMVIPTSVNLLLSITFLRISTRHKERHESKVKAMAARIGILAGCALASVALSKVINSKRVEDVNERRRERSRAAPAPAPAPPPPSTTHRSGLSLAAYALHGALTAALAAAALAAPDAWVPVLGATLLALAALLGGLALLLRRPCPMAQRSAKPAAAVQPGTTEVGAEALQQDPAATTTAEATAAAAAAAAVPCSSTAALLADQLQPQPQPAPSAGSLLRWRRAAAAPPPPSPAELEAQRAARWAAAAAALNGVWVKDKRASDPMSEACDVMRLGGLVRTAILLIRGIEIK